MAVVCNRRHERIGGLPKKLLDKPGAPELPPVPPLAVTAALPALPEGLQYKFIGRDLVLVDVDANVIVDVLPDAVPPGDRPERTEARGTP